MDAKTKKVIIETTECWCGKGDASLMDVSPQQTQIVDKHAEVGELLGKLKDASAEKKKEILGLILLKVKEVKDLETPVNKAPAFP